MEKYMIGDEFGNMWNEEDNEFFCNKGTVFNSKEVAKSTIDELSQSGKYYDWKLKLWSLSRK